MYIGTGKNVNYQCRSVRALENRVLVVEEADVISRYHRTARVSSTEAGYCFATYFFTSVISILYTEQRLTVNGYGCSSC